MLSDDHTVAIAAAKGLAQKEAVTLKASSVAATVQARSRVLVDQLAGSPDQSFDALYIDAEITAHDEALVLLESLHSGADSPMLKALLLDAKDVVSAHAAEAEKLP
jgi:putative membrane protein